MISCSSTADTTSRAGGAQATPFLRARITSSRPSEYLSFFHQGLSASTSQESMVVFALDRFVKAAVKG